MFWGYLLLTIKLSFASLLFLYVLYFVFEVIARKMFVRRQTDTLGLSLHGLRDEKNNTLFYFVGYVLLFSAGMSANSAILKWMGLVVAAILIISEVVHWIIELISLAVVPRDEKTHVLVHALPFTVGVYIWAILCYNMIHNFGVIAWI